MADPWKDAVDIVQPKFRAPVRVAGVAFAVLGAIAAVGSTALGCGLALQRADVLAQAERMIEESETRRNTEIQSVVVAVREVQAEQARTTAQVDALVWAVDALIGVLQAER